MTALRESVSKTIARGRLHTPGGITRALYVNDSVGATRGDRKIVPCESRNASFTTPLYVKTINFSSVALMGYWADRRRTK